jgi:8-oxo-dGTP diphosphatase
VGTGALARPAERSATAAGSNSHLNSPIESLSMKREFPEVPLVGVGAIIIEENRVVLVKRAHPPLQAQWSIPGGVLEVGELVRTAAIREAREETGLIVEPGELLGVYDRVLRDADQRVQYHYVLIDFLCRRVGGELFAASDAAEVHWFTRGELHALKLAADTQDVIRKGFEKLGR